MRKSILTVAACAALLSVGTAQAADPTVKCRQSKLKAQGKLQSCLKKNAAGVQGGKTDGSADCQTKFTAALQKADDKATAAATSCRYIDNNDGTVSDLNTGLVWEKKIAGSSCTHCVNDTYTWSTGSPYGPNGTAFSTFLYALNGATSTNGTDTATACFAGHCDWRLPTIQELQGIVDGSQSPTIDPVFGPTKSDGYWSATTFDVITFYAWGVLFTNGIAVNDNKTNGIYVRAVRGGL